MSELNLEAIEKQIERDEGICPTIVKKLINEIRELRLQIKDENDTLLAAYMSGRYDGKHDVLKEASYEH